uniref:MSP domain-containing protein n=1 Tax=Panagrellus redivivus TaxID=6233 RepID=A0A7E4ZT00_PANRE
MLILFMEKIVLMSNTQTPEPRGPSNTVLKAPSPIFRVPSGVSDPRKMASPPQQSDDPPAFALSPVRVARFPATEQHVAQLHAEKAIRACRGTNVQQVTAATTVTTNLTELLKVEPSNKLVFNAPYDRSHTAVMRLTNNGNARVGWAIKTTFINRRTQEEWFVSDSNRRMEGGVVNDFKPITVVPPSGLLDVGQSVKVDIIRQVIPKEVTRIRDDVLCIVATTTNANIAAGYAGYGNVEKKMRIIYNN